MPFQRTQFIVWAIPMRAKTGCSWKYLTNVVVMCCATVIFGFVLMFFWKYKSPFYNFMIRYIFTALDLLLDVIKFCIHLWALYTTSVYKLWDSGSEWKNSAHCINVKKISFVFDSSSFSPIGTMLCCRNMHKMVTCWIR